MIEINNYQLAIKDKIILETVNLNVRAGDKVLITGPNGSGKSLLLKAILAKPSTQIVNTFESSGAVIEKSKLIPQMTGLGFLQFLNKLDGVDQELKNQRAVELIDYFGIEQYKKQLIKTYSLGTTHKFALIQAFMHNPQLILLDEPFDSLDKASIKLLVDLINEQIKFGTTFIIVAHNYEQAKEWIDFNKFVEIENQTLNVQ